MTVPIKPDQVKSVKPDAVFEAFNDLIQLGWDGTQAKVIQSEASRIIAKELDISEDEVVAKRYLDIEAEYEVAGWEVRYEPFERDYTFSSSKISSRTICLERCL